MDDNILTLSGLNQGYTRAPIISNGLSNLMFKFIFKNNNKYIFASRLHTNELWTIWYKIRKKKKKRIHKKGSTKTKAVHSQHLFSWIWWKKKCLFLFRSETNLLKLSDFKKRFLRAALKDAFPINILFK